jgi:hypothetical protein
MFKFSLLISAAMLVTISCNKQEELPVQINEVIFGHFYGFCVGEKCIEIFKLTGSKLYEDVSDNYPSSAQPYNGNFIEMDDEKFQLVSNLLENIPETLLASQDTVIGSPDAADGGGLYIAINNENGVRYWLIDQMKYNIPEDLHTFVDEINRNIALISD